MTLVLALSLQSGDFSEFQEDLEVSFGSELCVYKQETGLLELPFRFHCPSQPPTGLSSFPPINSHSGTAK